MKSYEKDLEEILAGQMLRSQVQGGQNYEEKNKEDEEAAASIQGRQF